MAVSAQAASERGKLAALTRSRKPDDPELIEARRNLRAEMLISHVARVLAEAPALSDEQRARISALLRNGGAS